jgi:hypothetical protein
VYGGDEGDGRHSITAHRHERHEPADGVEHVLEQSGIAPEGLVEHERVRNDRPPGFCWSDLLVGKRQLELILDRQHRMLPDHLDSLPRLEAQRGRARDD